MEINGKIKVIGSIVQVSASFQKRELVISTEEAYPQHILIEFHQDKTAFLDYYRLGEYVKVHINLRGREWMNPEGQTKYFNTITGWKIERLNVEQPAAAPAAAPMPQIPATSEYQQIKEEEFDDLPF